MADERTEFEIALKDSISPQLKQIAKDLKELRVSVTAGAADTGKGGSETATKMQRSVAGLGATAREAVKEVAGIGAFFGGLASGFIGGYASIQGIKSIAAMLHDMAKQGVHLQLFSEELGTSAQNLEHLSRAAEFLGFSSDEAAGNLAHLSAKWKELRTLREGAPAYKSLGEMGGYKLADQLMNAKNLMEALKAVTDAIKANEGRPKAQELLAQRLEMQLSYLRQIQQGLKDVPKPPPRDENAEREFWQNITRLQHKFDDEWKLFSDHAMERLNPFLKTLDDWMEQHHESFKKFGDEFWQAFDERLKEETRSLETILGLIKFLLDLDRKTSIDPSAVLKTLRDTSARATGRATPEQKKRLDEQEIETLREIREGIRAWEYLDPSFWPPSRGALFRPGIGPRARRGALGSGGFVDEKGVAVDPETEKQIEVLAAKGDVPGMQALLNAKGFQATGPWCGKVAAGYARAAGFQPPS